MTRSEAYAEGFQEGLRERFWIADPSAEDVWADPRAATEWRVVDENAGGTVAYAPTLEEAQRKLEELRNA